MRATEIARTTMSVTQEQVHGALEEVLDPNTGKDFFVTKSARNIKVEGGSVSLDVELGYPAKTQLDPIRKLIAGKLRGIPGVSAVNVSVTSKIGEGSVFTIRLPVGAVAAARESARETEPARVGNAAA